MSAPAMPSPIGAPMFGVFDNSSAPSETRTEWSQLIRSFTSSLTGSLDAPAKPVDHGALSRWPKAGTRINQLAGSHVLNRNFQNAARVFQDLLSSITPPLSPTAQLVVDEDGAIQSTWLVNRNELNLSLDIDGSGFILATSSDGSILIDEEFAVDLRPYHVGTLFTDPLEKQTLLEARRFLASLGEKIDYRVWH